MFAGLATAGIAIVYEPVLAVDMTHQDHHVVIANDGHPGGGLRAGKLAHPRGGEIEFAADFAEHVERGLAAAEFRRASRGPAADHGFIAVGVDGVQEGGAASVPRADRRVPIRAPVQVADNDRGVRRLPSPGLGSGRGRDQPGSEWHHEHGCGFYQVSLDSGALAGG